MAGTAPSSSSPNGTPAPADAPRRRAVRANPVLVPQEALTGQPDVPLSRAVTVVGSAETCRLALQSRTVSRHHAVFLVDHGTTVVADLASRTGVLVNAKPVHEAELKPGDRVQIGKFVFRYRSADVPPTDPPPPPAPAAAAVVTGLLSIPLPGRLALIGRRETSDVALIGDAGVSAAHAALFHAGGQWYVRDLGSRTGTTVNGKPIVQQAVHFGDRIGVGAATIQFEPAAAVVGHAPLAAGLALSDSGPLAPPLPTEDAPLPLVLEDEPADAAPGMPLGVVTAGAVPIDPATIHSDAANSAADSAADSPVAAFAAELAADSAVHRPPPRPIPFAHLDPALPGEAEPVSSAAHRPPPQPMPVAPLTATADGWSESAATGDPTDLDTGSAAADPTIDLPAAASEAGEASDATTATEPSIDPGFVAAFDLPTEPLGSEQLLSSAAEPSGSAEGSASAGEMGAPVGEPAAEPLGSDGPNESAIALPPEPVGGAAEPTADLGFESTAADVTGAAEAFDLAAVAEPTPDLSSAEPIWDASPDLAPASPAVGMVLEPFPAADMTAAPPATAEALPAEPELADVADRVAEAPPAADVVPPPAPAIVPAAADLLGEVSDFVFVPEAAAAFVPDEIFWGDTDLDAELAAAPPTAARATTPPEPLPPVANNASPEPAAPAEPAVPLAAEPPAEPAASAPVGEFTESSPFDADATPDSAEPVDAGAVGDTVSPPESDTVDVPEAAASWDAAVPKEVEPPKLPAVVGILPEVETVIEADGATASAGLATDAVPDDAFLADAEPSDSAAVLPAVEADAWADELPAATGPVTGGASLVDAVPPDPSAVLSDGEADVWADAFPADAVPSAEHGATLGAALPLGDTAFELIGDGSGPIDLLPLTDGAEAQPVETGVETDARVAPAVESAAAEEPAQMLPIEGLDAALAVTPADAGAAAELAVEPIAFDDQLSDAAPASAADGSGDELGTAVVAADEPAGFDLDLSDVGTIDNGAADADWAGLDLLDLSEPAADAVGVVVNVDDGISLGTASAGVPLLPDSGGDDFDLPAFEDPAELPAAVAEPMTPEPAEPAEAVAPEGSVESPTVGLPAGETGAASGATEETTELPAVQVQAVAAERPVVEVASVVEEPLLPAAAVDVDVPPAAVDVTATEPVAEPGAAPRMSGPSLFGFNFEGGSFLGGMPLPLSGPPAALPPGGIVFDRPASDVLPDAPAALTATTGVAAEVPPVVESPFATAAAEPGPTPEIPEARVRPATPPRPLGLTGLVSGTGALADPLPTPVLPAGVVGAAAAVARAIPPLPVPPPAGFPPANGRARSADVFSQMAGPMSVVEAFGTRPSRGESTVVPDLDRSARATPAEPPPSPPARPPAYRPPDARRLIPPPVPRKNKVRWLAAACVLGPGVWATGVYLTVPKTATVVGTLHYAGLATQSDGAKRLFRGDQVSRLCGDDVRTLARAALVAAGEPTGPTEDSIAMGQAMQDPIKCEWTDDALKVVYQAPDAAGGRAQVEALLSTLRAQDESLGDVRARAVHEWDAAKAVSAAAGKARDDAKAEFDRQVATAQDRPDKTTLDAMDHADDDAARRADATHAVRVAAESALAGAKSQDAAHPADASNDPQVADLRRQLQPIQGQIAKARQLAGVTDAAATPAGGDDDDNPLLTQLKNRAKLLQDQIAARESDLAHTAALPAAERAARRESTIKGVTEQMTGLRQDEADAAAAAKAATAAAADAHAKTDAAHLADARASDLHNQLDDAKTKLQEASDDELVKQHAAEAAVTVDGSAASNPDVSVPGGERDPRPLAALAGGGLIFLVLGGWLLRVAGTGEADPSEMDDGAGHEAAVEDREPVGV